MVLPLIVTALLATRLLYTATVGIHFFHLNPSELRLDDVHGTVPAGQQIEFAANFQNDSGYRLPSRLLASQGVRFVFFMGLEGSGHDRIKQYVRYTSTSLKLNQLGLRETIRDLQDALYSSAGLFFLHCRLRGYQSEIQLNLTSQEPAHPIRIGGMTPKRLEYLNVAKAFQRVILLFQNVSHSLGGHNINVPLNADGYIAPAGTYPQDHDSCRRLKHPNLDLLYYACHASGVDCRHIYLHRGSTHLMTHVDAPNRAPKLSAIHLYTTLLNVMFAQLAKYPSSVLACLDVCDPLHDIHWRRLIDDLFGAREESPTAFQPGNIFGCATSSNSERLPVRNVYLESMEAASRRTQSMCHRLVLDLSRPVSVEREKATEVSTVNM